MSSGPCSSNLSVTHRAWRPRLGSCTAAGCPRLPTIFQHLRHRTHPYCLAILSYTSKPGSSRRISPCLRSLTSPPMTASWPTLLPNVPATLPQLHPTPTPKPTATKLSLQATSTKSKRQYPRPKVEYWMMGELKLPRTIATTSSDLAFPYGRNGPSSPSSLPSRCP